MKILSAQLEKQLASRWQKIALLAVALSALLLLSFAGWNSLDREITASSEFVREVRPDTAGVNTIQAFRENRQLDSIANQNPFE